MSGKVITVGTQVLALVGPKTVKAGEDNGTVAVSGPVNKQKRGKQLQETAGLELIYPLLQTVNGWCFGLT